MGKLLTKAAVCSGVSQLLFFLVLVLKPEIPYKEIDDGLLIMTV